MLDAQFVKTEHFDHNHATLPPFSGELKMPSKRTKLQSENRFTVSVFRPSAGRFAAGFRQ